jgi:hypothetical protein
MATKLELWSDLNEQLITDSSGNIKKSINIEAVKTSIDNILRTSKGERVMLPEFASDLQSLVFENLNDSLAQMLSNSVKNSIEIWDPRVKVLNISLEPNADNNYVKIKIEFNIVGYIGPVVYMGNFNIGS